MSNITLRPYQQELIDAIRHEFTQGNKRVVAVAPCGAGKTIITGWMIRQAAWRGKRSIFLVHRRELIEQTAKTFTELDIPFGIIASGLDMNLSLPVQIASVQTLNRRLGHMPPTDFLICDECLHIANICGYKDGWAWHQWQNIADSKSLIFSSPLAILPMKFILPPKGIPYLLTR